ncbi:outer membrane lipoprotein carrier protein LolA [Paenibacillus sp. HJGM_3]
MVNDLDHVVSKLDSYQGSGQMILQTGQQPQKYDVEVWYQAPHFYRISLTNESKDVTQIVLRNDEGVFVLTPHLNKMFRFQSDWPENSGQVYLYQSLVQSIVTDTERQFNTEKDAYVFDVAANYQNGLLARQKIWLNKKTLAPQHVEVSDERNNVMVVVDFTQFEFGKKFEKDSFDMQRNMTSWNLKSMPTTATGGTSTNTKAGSPEAGTATGTAAGSTATGTGGTAGAAGSSKATTGTTSGTQGTSATTGTGTTGDGKAGASTGTAATGDGKAGASTGTAADGAGKAGAGTGTGTGTAANAGATGNGTTSGTANSTAANGSSTAATGSTSAAGANGATKSGTAAGTTGTGSANGAATSGAAAGAGAKAGTTTDASKSGTTTDASKSSPTSSTSTGAATGTGAAATAQNNHEALQQVLGLVEPEYTPKNVVKQEVKQIKVGDEQAILFRYTGKYNYTLTEMQPRAVTVTFLPGDILDLGYTLGVVTGDKNGLRTLTWTYDGMEYRLSTSDLPQTEMIQIAQSVQGQVGK